VCSCGEEGVKPSTGGDSDGPYVVSSTFATGRLSTPAGDIPVVSSRLNRRDRLGTFRVRWGIGRDRYAIAPGLYALGSPDPRSPVLVTANYKLSFDKLRASVAGLNAWILALDTLGINVWCAAGKGTFGTDEAVRRVETARVKGVVSHRTLIFPQLGAPGVAAHEVARRTGFRVVFGPVRAADLPAFLDAGMKATPEMRRVRFAFKDRLTLIPVELAGIAGNKGVLAVFILWLAAAIAGLKGAWGVGLALAGSILAGAALTPALLPWIPARMFAAKGALLGLIWAAFLCVLRGFPPEGAANIAGAAAGLLFLPALSAFLAMNFTGSSTFTSLSGVVAEMKTAVPLMILSSSFGLIAAVVFILLKI